MKFLCNMNISPKTVSYLRKLGYNSKRLDELNMECASDRAVIDLAYKEGRTIITIDLDYPEIIALGRKSFPSAIIFRLTNPDVDTLNTLLNEYLEKIKKDLKEGAIVIIEDEKVRIRSLPIEKLN